MNVVFSYLKLPFLVWSEGLPLRGIDKLVAVDVMQELAFKRYIDPGVGGGGGWTGISNNSHVNIHMHISVRGYLFKFL